MCVYYCSTYYMVQITYHMVQTLITTGTSRKLCDSGHSIQVLQ